MKAVISHRILMLEGTVFLVGKPGEGSYTANGGRARTGTQWDPRPGPL